jgi:hypothetical protein
MSATTLPMAVPFRYLPRAGTLHPVPTAALSETHRSGARGAKQNPDADHFPSASPGNGDHDASGTRTGEQYFAIKNRLRPLCVLQ